MRVVSWRVAAGIVFRDSGEASTRHAWLPAPHFPSLVVHSVIIPPQSDDAERACSDRGAGWRSPTRPAPIATAAVPNSNNCSKPDYTSSSHLYPTFPPDICRHHVLVPG